MYFRLPAQLLPEDYGNLEKGDEIIEINGVPIKWQNQEEINKLLQLNRDHVTLTIDRKGTRELNSRRGSKSASNSPQLTPTSYTRTHSFGTNHSLPIPQPKSHRSVSVPQTPAEVIVPLWYSKGTHADTSQSDSQNQLVLVEGSLGPSADEEMKQLEESAVRYVKITNETTATVDIPKLAQLHSSGMAG